jgi:EpsI family protein
MKMDSGWAPALILALGVLLVSNGDREQFALPLRTPLESSIPSDLLGFAGSDVEVSPEEQAVAGMTSFVLRNYTRANGTEGSAAAFSVYVGYYEKQSQGKTIHSPRNCLPGGGWEPLVSAREQITTPAGAIPVNRYLIGNGGAKALVLYWYQGRGRVEANEYLVKWQLLKDQALRGRSDEALVRVIVPVTTTEAEAYTQAVQVAGQLVSRVNAALPT